MKSGKQPTAPPRPFIPYSRPVLAEDDIAAVVEVLSSSTISQGQRLADFESAFAAYVGVPFAHAYSSGTAAIHAMCDAAGLGPGDEVIVPALTFAGTANAIRYVGATPVFADIDPATNCVDPSDVERRVGPATRAILAVDFAGQPCDYPALREIANAGNLLLLADAAHAAGARIAEKRIGAVADMTAFSFNPVKNITAAEGGMVTTASEVWSKRLKMFGSHGMTRDPALLESPAPAGWYYEQQFLGYNYKLSELHAALGNAQLNKLDLYNQHRRKLAEFYESKLADLPLTLPRRVGDVLHAWHLYIVRLSEADAPLRDELFETMRANGFGVQLHYIPVPLHPDYRRLGYDMSDLQHTRRYFETAISLPLNPSIDQDDCMAVVDLLRDWLTSRDPRNRLNTE